MSGTPYVELSDNGISPMSSSLRLGGGLAGLVLTGVAGLMSLTSLRFSTPEKGSEILKTKYKFIPREGMEGVIVRPGFPAGLLLPPPFAKAECLFIYASPLMGKEVLSGSNFQPGRIYGAMAGTDMAPLATPTGARRDIVKGKLQCYPSSVFPEKLKFADSLIGFDPAQPTKGQVRRSMCTVVKEDGYSESAYWYYQDNPGAVQSASGKPHPTIAMFGCSGGTGLATLQKLVQAAYNVQCLVRNPDKLPEELKSSHQVKLLVGDARDEMLVMQTVTGADAVVVVLGGNTTNNEVFAVLGKFRVGSEVNICSQAQPIINRAVNKICPDARMVVVTSLGVGSSYKYCSFATKAIVNTVLRQAIADKNLQEEMVTKEIKNYIFVRPVLGLNRNAGTGRWKAAEDVEGGNLPREDLASFVVQDALNTAKWLKKGVTVVGVDKL
eukprot:gb/GEZN01005502.1/.p1 GENE.gb/GEZN01005502.1/~~gb/GEZN01005502.1/.p1  ORF type:complete len:439 (+),score=63.45 gb/GEZN01005502.1/:23-1339(+)